MDGQYLPDSAFEGPKMLRGPARRQLRLANSSGDLIQEWWQVAMANRNTSAHSVISLFVIRPIQLSTIDYLFVITLVLNQYHELHRLILLTREFSSAVSKPLFEKLNFVEHSRTASISV